MQSDCGGSLAAEVPEGPCEGACVLGPAQGHRPLLAALLRDDEEWDAVDVHVALRVGVLFDDAVKATAALEPLHGIHGLGEANLLHRLCGPFRCRDVAATLVRELVELVDELQVALSLLLAAEAIRGVELIEICTEPVGVHGVRPPRPLLEPEPHRLAPVPQGVGPAVSAPPAAIVGLVVLSLLLRPRVYHVGLVRDRDLSAILRGFIHGLHQAAVTDITPGSGDVRVDVDLQLLARHRSEGCSLTR
mmetsp:Transcript_31571/g.71751  ORF Transcript_31571/g.71751 Transcript_31571/m.71751 type:complete len:247 (+) Transcript_31571:37-777(+)